MKLNSKSLNTNKISKNTMKKPIIILASILFIFIFASLVNAATITSQHINSDGVINGTFNLSVRVAITAVDVNVTNVTWFYRSGTSGAWTPINSSGLLNFISYQTLWDTTAVADGTTYEINITSARANVTSLNLSGALHISGIDIDNTAPTSSTLTFDREVINPLQSNTFICSGNDGVDSSMNTLLLLFKPDNTQVTYTSNNQSSNRYTTEISGSDVDQKGEYSAYCQVTDDTSLSLNSSKLILNVKGEDAPIEITPGTPGGGVISQPMDLTIVILLVIISIVVIGSIVIFLLLEAKKPKKRSGRIPTIKGGGS